MRTCNLHRWPASACQILAVCLAVLIAGCSSGMKVRTEVDPLAPLSTYHTYAWATSEPHVIGSAVPPKEIALVDWRIRAAVDAQLLAKGYAHVTQADPDVHVDYRMQFVTKTTDTAQEYYWYRRLGGKESLLEAFVFGYDEAVLTVELSDPTTERVVWRGTATAAGTPDSDPTLINDAVHLIIQRLP